MVDPVERYVAFFVGHRRGIVVGLIAVTLVLGSGMATLDPAPSIAGFDVDSEESEAAAYVETHFDTGDRTVTFVVFRGEDLLSKTSMQETMALQRAIHGNETVNATLVDDPATIGVPNAIVETELRSLGVHTQLTVDDTARTLDTFSEPELRAGLAEMVSDDRQIMGPGTTASSLLPVDYTAGDPDVEARLMLVVHDRDVEDADLETAQFAVERLANEHVRTADTVVFGEGIVERVAADATGATFIIVGPIALLFVMGFLVLGYRDPVDVALSVLGVAVTLVWTAGFVGWMGFEVTQLLVAVPWLLLGLGVDYGLHVTMRYREELETGVGNQERAMFEGLVGVLVAVGATTLTTAAGFFSGVVSPMGAIREFAIVSGFGIVSAFVVFGGFIPALKLEIDTRQSRDRRWTTTRSLGDVGLVSTLVRPGIALSRRAPLLVVFLALLVTAGGLYGAVNVDTSTDQSDFYPTDPPRWVDVMPSALQPETTDLYERATYLETTFGTMGEDDRVSILVRGNVTEPTMLRTIADAENVAHRSSIVQNREGAVYTPIDALETVAEWNQTVADRFDAVDTTDDGVPDRDLRELYELAYAADPAALDPVMHRTENGEYLAIRVVVAVDSGAESSTVVSESRAIAELVEDESDQSVTATGSPVLTGVEERALFRTLVGTFILALTVTIGVLGIVLERRFGSISLGIVTILPVLFVLSWVLGSMYLLGIPYNAETAIIAGVAIGLGIDYAIHVSTRFAQEREKTDLTGAIDRAVSETGGVLLLSAATTTVAVGVLGVAFVPSLQRFGIVTALVIVYAYLTTVYVLPSLLVLRERWL